MIVIVDYGLGNLRSIQKSFDRIGHHSIISNRFEDINSASKLVLPGVGNFQHAMSNINELGLKSKLDNLVLNENKPILGICLGMQLMTKSSEEGNVNGFGWINAVTKKFKVDYKIPNIGWSKSKFLFENQLNKGIKLSDEFYYVHSYYVETFDNKINIFVTNYRNDFVSGFAYDNIFGVQFHPEKSYEPGLILLDNFAKIK